MATLDKFDRQILGLMQQDCRQSAEQIADRVGLSATAVQRRIKRLRETGVIQAEVALVDAQAVGLGVSVLVEVELAEASREAVIDGFKRRMVARPEVQQCLYVAGASDFVLLIAAADLASFERLTRELFFDDPNIKKFRSTFVLESAKLGLALPLAV
ncbi:Lrp/AsnC family transcriptional regulator [Paucibacter sp. DJ2R-2]|uniref:Lrp/AsnC family transcriptional regulator n=1 Tax=Paucibacter sp. DJ2R-2 TaxID=2893558 RepID=UPI0021E4386E|nr:Lrp/AsnC family transcriptional regulator [Paucibacter sp. DJ2R-2]MCV2422046.1 Lrp/AsnC family transcriptional regulator [Paucibacter sp. DJ4R-1]MCV2439337.1 Lrp/AsnC family transcriptional regulator [Paucibacter sp. DJ2R-2]